MWLVNIQMLQTHITGEVSFSFSSEYGEGVQTQFETLLPLLLPVTLVYFLQEEVQPSPFTGRQKYTKHSPVTNIPLVCSNNPG